MLVSLCAVCASTSVSAAPSSSVNSQSALVGAPAGIVGAPAVCDKRLPGYYDNFSLELFVRGTDNALWWKNLNKTTQSWSAWQNLGGYLTSSPAAASRTTDEISVFVRGGDGALWSRNIQAGSANWSSWTSLGGRLLAGTDPAACPHVFPVGGGSIIEGISVLVTGTGHALWHKTYNSPPTGGWSAWENLGGYLTSSPAAAMTDKDPDGFPILHAYVRGGDGALWEYGGSWSKIGGQLLAGTGPAACEIYGNDYGQLIDVVVTGTGHALYHKAYVPGSEPSKSWSEWQNLGGYLTSSPAATFLLWPSPFQGYVFVRGGDGEIWQKSWTNSGWAEWSGPMSGPP